MRHSVPSLRAVIPRLKTLKDAECKDVLSRCTPVTYSSLSNGVRVATEYIKGCPFATLGVWIDTGSRFETPSNNGVAHFLEHMNFKGTKKYSKADVENAFEHSGSHFNAYTSRDRTAYYVKGFTDRIPQLLDVVADLLVNSEYNPAYIRMERPTILAEMREVETLVEEVIMDNLHKAAYDSESSGLPLTILGPVENISKTINQAMIRDFVSTHYTGPRMCLVSSGGISPDETHKLAEKYFGNYSAVNNRPVLRAQYKGGTAIMWNETMATSNTVVAFGGCGAVHPDSFALQLALNLIGQLREGQQGQFIQQHRMPLLPFEKAPNLVQLRPFYTPYEETSLIGYHIVTARMTEGTERDESQTALLNFILSNFYDLATKLVDEKALEMAKSEYKASSLLIRDSTTNSAEEIGRQMIHIGRRIENEKLFEQVDSITPSHLRDVFSKYFLAHKPTVACIGAASTIPKYGPLEDTDLRLNPQDYFGNPAYIQ